MEKIWMLVYPIQDQEDKWYHITNLLDAGEVYQYALSHLMTHKIRAISICGKNDMRRWFFSSTREIECFYNYLKNNTNTDDLKLRMKAKEK